MNLNQVILDGKISKIETKKNEENVIKSLVATMLNGTENTNSFECAFYGCLLEFVLRELKVNQNVRIVGRLRQENSKTIIVCEHLDIKAMAKNNL